MRRTVLALVFLLISVTYCVAQQPSLAETTNFLQAKIQGSTVKGAAEGLGPDDCTYMVDVFIRFPQFEVSGCSVALTETIARAVTAISPGCHTRGDPPVEEQKVHFSFKHLAIDSLLVSEASARDFSIASWTVKAPYSYVQLSFAEPVSEMTNGVEKTTNSWSVEVQDKELAERLLKAFKHAAQLCGAKKEAF